MAVATWSDLFVAALGGGLTVKAADIVYLEVRRWWDSSRDAAEFVDSHLDPLLKSADELVGKLRSLAESDFKAIARIDRPDVPLAGSEFSSLVFLFARFWARVEVFRQEGLSVSTSKDKRGKRLNAFLDCLESRRVRVADRITQRAVGEAMIIENGVTLGFTKFVEAYEKDEGIRRWIEPLVGVLSRTRHTTERQRILQYGVVVHAMIDTLDPSHLVTRSRPSYPNKLTKKSWRALRYRVFGQYLPFASSAKYLIRPRIEKGDRRTLNPGGLVRPLVRLLARGRLAAQTHQPK